MSFERCAATRTPELGMRGKVCLLCGAIRYSLRPSRASSLRLAATMAAVTARVMATFSAIKATGGSCRGLYSHIKTSSGVGR